MEFSHLGVVDRWPASPKQARYSALVALSCKEDKYATKCKKSCSSLDSYCRVLWNSFLFL